MGWLNDIFSGSPNAGTGATDYLGGLIHYKAPDGQTSSDRMGLFGSALQDAGAYLNGTPGAATNLRETMADTKQADARRLLSQAFSSSDPAIQAKAVQTALAMGIDPTPWKQQAASAALPTLLKNLQPQPVTDIQPTAPITGPGQFQARQDAGAYGGPTAVQPSLSDALAATNSPELTAQVAPSLIDQQADLAAKRVTPLSAQDAQARGLRAGGVYGTDAAGNIVTIQPSDMKSAGAVQQDKDEALFGNNLPLTPYQKAEIGMQGAQLNKPVAVGFGQSLVSPRTGQVLFSGDSGIDPKAVQLGVNYFIANGGKMPPTARTPALQMAIMSGANDYLASNNMTMDDLVNKGIGLHARTGAAAQTARQQAGTAINEDTVTGGMNILQGLLNKGAAAPTSVQGVNDVIQWAKKQGNNPDAVNLANAISTISNEYARVMTGTTNGSPSSDSARNEAAKRLTEGMNKGTMQQVMGQMHYEMRQRSMAQAGALKQLTGGAYGGVGASITPQGLPVPENLPRATAATAPKIIRYDANGNRIQ